MKKQYNLFKVVIPALVLAACMGSGQYVAKLGSIKDLKEGAVVSFAGSKIGVLNTVSKKNEGYEVTFKLDQKNGLSLNKEVCALAIAPATGASVSRLLIVNIGPEQNSSGKLIRECGPESKSQVQLALRELGIEPEKKQRPKKKKRPRKVQVAEDDSDKYDQFSAERKALFDDLLGDQ